jgi:hypothetical protein
MIRPAKGEVSSDSCVKDNPKHEKEPPINTNQREWGVAYENVAFHPAHEKIRVHLHSLAVRLF